MRRLRPCLPFGFALLLAVSQVSACAGQEALVFGPPDANASAQVESVVDQYLPAVPETSAPRGAGDSGSLADSRAMLESDGADERLIDRIVDPTAWLMDLRLRQQWNWPVGDDPDSQTIQFRPTIPFRAWDHVNLLRISVPYHLEGSGGAGLTDVDMFDLVVFDASWGRWGIGPSLRLVPSSDDHNATFLAGPAGGAVSKTEHWTIGFLIQNFLGDDESQSRIQPILAYKPSDAWALSIGESEFRYQWGEARWTQLPLGVELDNIREVYGQKVQLFVNPQYNFQREASNSGWTLYLGVVLLVPDA